MKHCLLSLALALVATAMQAQLVLNTDFSTVSQFETYTVINANSDDQTWRYDDYNMAASCPRDYDSDDWLVTPQIQLSADKTYLVTFEAQLEQEGEETLTVMIGSGATVGAMTTTLIPTTGITSTTGERRSTIFTVSASGSYYIGFHCSTTNDPAYNCLYMKQIRVEETSDQGTPAPVTDLTVTPAKDGSLSAVVSLRTPSLNVGGTALAELTKVDLYRDETLILTFQNPAIGQVVIFTDTPPASGNYTYRAVPANRMGEGEATTVKAYVGTDKPGPVTNLRFVYDHATHTAKLTWDAPTVGANGGYLPPEGLTYNVRRVRATDAETAKGITTNSFEDVVDVSYMLQKEDEQRKKNEAEGLNTIVEFVVDGQCLMSYYVSAESAAGKGPETTSNYVVIGEPNTLPFNDTFADGKRTHYWRLDIADTRARWFVMADREDQNGDNGMLNFNAVTAETATAMCHTGNISMKEATSPMLSFYYFCAYAMTEPLLVKVSTEDGEFETIASIPLNEDSRTERYIRASVPLTGCAGHEYVKVGFQVTSNTSVDLVYIDNVSIIDQRQNDLSIEMTSLPRNLKVGEMRYLTANVRNLGVADVPMGNYSVDVYVNGLKAGSAVGMAINADQAQTVMVPVTATIDMPKQSDIYAEVVYAADEALDNNRTAVQQIDVKQPTYPAATGLQAATTDDGVVLSWSAPAAPRQADEPVTDSFEDYTDFQITNFGDWTVHDLDLHLTWTVGEQYAYANAGMPQAYMVWNNSQVRNILTGKVGLNSQQFTPRTGDKCLASFGVSLDRCDDWLVSPELSGNAQMISFYAHNTADSEATYTEQFQLYYSTTGVETTNFMALDQTPRYTTTEWQKFEYMLPVGTKYFALRKVTPYENSYALLIDDVTFVPDTLAAQTGLMHFGYYVYRNGERINTALVSAPTFTDPDGKPGDVYRVTALYNQGESVYSNEAVATAPDGISDVQRPSLSARRYDLGGRLVRPAAKGLTVQKGKKTILGL